MNNPINTHNYMKNKPLSAYKKKKIIESFLDELTATQAAHRLNLDRNTINKYFKRIRECIAGYREYQKMQLMITLMSTPNQTVQTVARQLPAANRAEDGIPIRIMCIDGQLLTEVDAPIAATGSKLMMKVSPHVNGYASEAAKRHAHPVDCNDLERVAEDFHSFTSQRFKKFFGIRSEYAYLYVKEAEFVFNERDLALRERILHQMTDQIFL